MTKLAYFFIDNLKSLLYNNVCVASVASVRMNAEDGVWLSLARAPGLGPGGRRFESCHPDYMRV